MALVKIARGTYERYNAAQKSADTLYVIPKEASSASNQWGLFLGDKKVSEQQIFSIVSGNATTSAGDNLFTVGANGNSLVVQGENGPIQIVKPFDTEIAAEGAGSNNAPTAAAVKAYVSAATAGLNLTELGNRVAALETYDGVIDGKLATIKGTGEGSISKAKQDAIDAANTAISTLENGKVATNASDIAGLKTGKADKATTLAGYGIGDAYTKNEADTKIAEAIADAGHLKRSIVEELPAASAADANTIYMKKVASDASKDNYEEYMKIGTEVVKIGDSSVDLSDYKTSAQVETAIATAKQEAITAAGTATTNAINALDKADTAVSGKYVSAVSETNGIITVTRADLPAAATLATGTSNGTVKFNGADVAVKGLGSAAYTASTAYATAAQGTLADNAVRSVTAGTANGTIKVKTGSAAAVDVAVTGLGSAAYTASTAYATAAQGTKADSALQAADIAEGTADGTIAVKGTNVSVHGLGSAAYTDSTAYDAAGSSQAVSTTLTTKINKVDTDWQAALSWVEL